MGAFFNSLEIKILPSLTFIIASSSRFFEERLDCFE